MRKDGRISAWRGWAASSLTIAVPIAALAGTQAAWTLVSQRPWQVWTVDDAVVAIALVVAVACAWRLSYVAVRTAYQVFHSRGRVSLADGGRWRRVVVTACVWVMGSAVAAPAVAAESFPSPGWVGDVAAVSEDTTTHSPEPTVPRADAAVVSPVDTVADEPMADVPVSQDPEADPPTSVSVQWSAPAEPSPAAAPEDKVETYTVARGDSLWRITSHLLGAAATDAEIARAWPQLYEHNRELVGANPHLIHPGQVLEIPQELRS